MDYDSVNDDDVTETKFPPLLCLEEDEEDVKRAIDLSLPRKRVASKLEEIVVLESPQSQTASRSSMHTALSPVTGHKQCDRDKGLDDPKSNLDFIEHEFLFEEMLPSPNRTEFRDVALYPETKESSSIEGVVVKPRPKKEKITEMGNCATSFVKGGANLYEKLPSDEESSLTPSHGHLSIMKHSTRKSLPSTKEFDVLKYLALEGETKYDTVKRLGHDAVWNCALQALIEGKHVIGDEIIYGKESWRNANITREQLEECFGCSRNSLSPSRTSSSQPHFLGGCLQNTSSVTRQKWVQGIGGPQSKQNTFRRRMFRKKRTIRPR